MYHFELIDLVTYYFNLLFLRYTKPTTINAIIAKAKTNATGIQNGANTQIQGHSIT